MLRDKSLLRFSHQHQHALALCVRIHRALESGDTSLRQWQAEIRALFEREIEAHFEAEEYILFPAAARFNEVETLVSELLAEHVMLRSYNLAAIALSLSRGDLADFANALSIHVRKEERDLFERMQSLMSPEELARLGQQADDFFGQRDGTPEQES